MTLKIDQRRDKVRRLVTADPNLSLRDVARQVGVGKDAVARDMRALGLTSRPAVARRRTPSRDTTATANTPAADTTGETGATDASDIVRALQGDTDTPVSRDTRLVAVRHLSAAARAGGTVAETADTWRAAARATLRAIIDRLADDRPGRDPEDLADAVELIAAYAATRGITWPALHAIGADRSAALGEYPAGIVAPATN